MRRAMSLHIGLNGVDAAAYGGWGGELQACESDAHSMEKVTTALGYKTQKLLSKHATSEAVIAAISNASKALEDGDIFVLSYSGHGGQVPDKNGDEPDGKDETWVLYDRELVDDELHELYTTFKPGARVFVLSDSCHSGTVTRGLFDGLTRLEAEHGMRRKGDPLPKAMPKEIADREYYRQQKRYDDIQVRTKATVMKSPEATVLLISGCQDNQLSSDGDVNGLFTEKLLGVWNSGKFAHDYRNFQRAIKKQMPPSQQPNYFVVGAANKAYERQHPFQI